MSGTITPCLWFDGRAEEAAQFYTSVFEDSRIKEVSRYGEAGPGEPGTVLTVVFEIRGQELTALNGGPQFSFTEAVSFQVPCDTQDEIDRLWAALTDGGQESQCGWLKDRFGLSWQIVPSSLGRLMGDPAGAERVMAALMPMTKIDIAVLEKAAAG